MKCRYCGKVCTSKSGLTLHLQNCETRQSLTCLICGKECTSKSGLSLHLKSCRSPVAVAVEEPPAETEETILDSTSCRKKGFRLVFDDDQDSFVVTIGKRMMGVGSTTAAAIEDMKKTITKQNRVPTSYFVIYCKISDDELEGIDMEYPFIGGESKTKNEAEELAKRIVRENRNSTIIPKIYKANGNKETLTTIMERAKRHFYTMYRDMLESHRIYRRTRR